MKLNFFENILRKKPGDDTAEQSFDTKEQEIPLSKTPETPEEKILKEGKTKEGKSLRDDGRVIFIKIRGNGAGIFKPKKKERDWIEKEKGTHYRRERAAYLISRFLDLDLVPPTVIRNLGGKGVGSMQQFIKNAKGFAEISPDENIRMKKTEKEQLIKLWLFDYIIWNTDRHDNNYLFKKNKVYAIDNEFTFSYHTFGPTYGEARYAHASLDYFNTPIPQNIIKIFEKFLAWSEAKEILRDLLQELLDKKEVNACIRRIERIGKFMRQGEIPSSKRDELTFE